MRCLFFIFTFQKSKSFSQIVTLQLLLYECLRATFKLLIYNVKIVFSKLLGSSTYFSHIPDVQFVVSRPVSMDASKFYAHFFVSKCHLIDLKFKNLKKIHWKHYHFTCKNVHFSENEKDF